MGLLNYKNNQTKEYCLIGLNKFNLEIGKILMESGHKVTAIDSDVKKIDNYGNLFNYAISCDAANIKELQDIGMENFDFVVVGMTDVGTSVIITTNLIELNVDKKKILCKAKDESHKRILKCFGITSVYIPEEEIAVKVSYKIMHDLHVDALSIKEHKNILVTRIPLNNSKLWGKKIKEIAFFQASFITIISVQRANGTIIVPVSGFNTLEKGDIVCVICNTANITKVNDYLRQGM